MNNISVSIKTEQSAFLVAKNESVLEADFKETLAIKIGYWTLRKILAPIIRLLWIEHFEGIEHIPKRGPVIIVSNHTSYLDFFCFLAISPRGVYYLAAEKFWEKPVWRLIMQITGQVKVNRKEHGKDAVYKAVAAVLGRGHALGIFPEGTRSPNGEILKPFTGVAKFAIRHKVPVLPVGMHGTFEVLSRHDKRPKLKKIVRVHVGPTLHFMEYHDRELEESHFEEVTHSIMRRVAELAGKKYNHHLKPEYCDA